jgi:hypothetical protein
MSDDDHAPPPQQTGDRIDAGLADLLAGPSPINMVLAALWGPSW